VLHNCFIDDPFEGDADLFEQFEEFFIIGGHDEINGGARNANIEYRNPKPAGWLAPQYRNSNLRVFKMFDFDIYDLR